MNKFRRAIITRPSVSMTTLVGVGAFGADGTRDVTAWVQSLAVRTLDDGRGVVAVLTPAGRTLVHTMREGRTDDELRVLAAQATMDQTGVPLSIEYEPDALPAEELALPRSARRARTADEKE